MLGIKLIQLKG